MKNSILILLTLFCLEVIAQTDTIPNPTGYTSTQLRNKNILRVSPDDHIWIGFRSIGAAEYDGTAWRIYDNTTNLPSNNVTAFAFDGLIKWIGTDSGLIKTNGINILSFNTFNSPMPSNVINGLFIADSVLWIATNAGVVSYDGSNWNIYNTSNSNLSSDTILSINKNNFGMYVSTREDIFLLRNNVWKFVGRDYNFPFTRITSDASGNLFTGTRQIYDTILNPVSFPTDPCFYADNIIRNPTSIFGGNQNNITYAYSDIGFDENYLFELDSQLHILNSFKIDSFETYQALSQDHRLFDFNSTGELISANGLGSSGPSKIYKTNFSGFNPMQPIDSCPYLDINQVRARIWNNGSQFWDLEGEALYEVPKGSGKTAIFAEGMWIGGRDPLGKLHMAAQTYRQSGGDFWPGPLDTVTTDIDPATSVYYNKLWKIERYTINDFLFNYQNGNVTNGSYPIPESIQNWPAHGIGNISRSLAPFVDFNLDGIYNPMDGDYPKMKGEQMFWWVFNDNYSAHGETHSEYNLGVEIHGSAYAYNCPQLTSTDTVINYTTFYHYDIFNRSDTSYHDVYTATFTDIDLGNYLDDYVGCDTINDLAFAFNGDNDDENSFLQDNGYGLNPPMINLAFLNGPQASTNDGIDNNHNGITDEPGENCMMNYFIYYNGGGGPDGDPDTALEYYWRMQGLWKDSTHLTYGGTGYNNNSTDFTNYMFSGLPYDSTYGWSESHPCNGCQPNEPSDRRIFISSGPFDLPAHGHRSLDYAYIYTRQPNLPNGPNTSLTLNLEQVKLIKQYFYTDTFPCKHLIGIDELNKNDLDISLYPNPAHSEITVSITNADSHVTSYFITDVMGRKISTTVKILSSKFVISLNSFSSGLYFLHLMKGNNMYVKKFVVQ